MDTKKKLKTIGISVLAILVAIVIFQNTETTTLKFLAWEINAPRILLYPGLFGAGFLAGLLTHIFLQRRKRKENKASAKADAAVKEMEKKKKE